jgi:hypothetical protein
MICIMTRYCDYGTMGALKAVFKILLKKEGRPVNHTCFAGTTPRHRIMAVLGIIVLLSAATSCSPHRAPAETAAPYHPARIASGVQTQPGSASWSPNGKRIAFLTTTVNIYDRERGTLKTVGIKNPSYLLWPTEQELLVIVQSADTAVLCVVEPDTLAVTPHALDSDARALYPLDTNRLLVLSTKRTMLKFGIEMNYQLAAYDRRDNTQKRLYSFSKLYPRKTPEELLAAWLHAGPDPLNDALLVMELIKPPLLAPYTRLRNIDVLTGEAADIAAPQKTVYTATSWSPDGRRLALSDASGHLVITGPRAGGGSVEAAVAGFHPSWNPRGSLLYLGGYLVQSNGKTVAALLPDSPRSIAWWSGDGTRLAAVADGELWLFDAFVPVFLPPDKPLDDTLKNKLSLLKNLHRDGFVTLQEYQARRTRLLERSEVLP